MASAFICLPLLLQYYFFEATTLLKLGGGCMGLFSRVSLFSGDYGISYYRHELRGLD